MSGDQFRLVLSWLDTIDHLAARTLHIQGTRLSIVTLNLTRSWNEFVRRVCSPCPRPTVSFDMWLAIQKKLSDVSQRVVGCHKRFVSFTQFLNLPDCLSFHAYISNNTNLWTGSLSLTHIQDDDRHHSQVAHS